MEGNHIKNSIPGKLRSANRIVAVLLSAALAFPLTVNEDMFEHVKAADDVIRPGDVNDDMNINILDIIQLKSFIVENNSENFDKKSADIDSDGNITAKDALMLSMYLNGQIPLLTYEKDTDSDGDGLSDYAEFYLCGTDPMNPDTDSTGVTDDKKDSDDDGLTNKEEEDLGTSPTESDSDDDKISDYDEVKTYKTDPLCADTDNDNVSDYSEIKLGLDPDKNMSDAITPDSERIFDQELKSDSEVLSKINSDNDSYKLSVSTKSSGYIEESVNASVSRYTNYLQSDAVSGDIVDIDYAGDKKLESMTVSFDIPENAENYYIFKYFEDVNMLLPVETKYDSSRVYTEDTQDGTYCIVDMNRWLALNSTDYSQNLNNVGDPAFEASSDIEVYFLMYVTSATAEEARNSVAKASRDIIDFCNKKGKDIKIYFAAYTGNVVVSKQTGYNYISNTSTDEEIKEMLSRSGAAQQLLDTSSFNFSLTRALKKDLFEISGENTDSAKYCFVVDVNFTPSSSPTVSVIDEMKQYGVKFNFICNETNNNITDYDQLDSDGRHDKWVPDFSGLVEGKVISDTDIGQVLTFDAHTGLFNKIHYEAKITEDWLKAASGQLSEEEIEKLGLPDTDSDGVYDFKEIYMKLIKFDSSGNVILPTFEELCDRISNYADKRVNDAIRDIKLRYSKNGQLEQLLKTPILPLHSDPTVNDSDYDGIPDSADYDPVQEGETSIDGSVLDDSQIFDKSYSNNVDIKENGKFDYRQIDEPAGTDIKKPVIKYTRYCGSNNSVSRFTVHADKASDYSIELELGFENKYQVRVWNSPLAVKAVPMEETVEKDGDREKVKCTFGACTDASYYIEIKIYPQVNMLADGRQQYTVSFSQDNWVYAPYGGIAYTDKAFCGNIPGGTDYNAVYLKEEMLYAMTTHNGDSAFEWLRQKSDFMELMSEQLADCFYDKDDAQYLQFVKPVNDTETNINNKYAQNYTSDEMIGYLNEHYKWSSKVSEITTYIGGGLMFLGS